MRDGSHPDSRWDPLAEAARTDAARGAPRFSGALHARVIAAVRSADRAPEPDGRRTLNPWAIVGVAAMIIFILAAPRLYPTAPNAVATNPPEVAAHRLETLALATPPLRATLASLGRQESTLEADLGPTQLAGLDHDARVAARYVLSPLSFPSRGHK